MQMKRKAERTSKNHIQAKNDWREKLEKLENGEINPKDLDLKPKVQSSHTGQTKPTSTLN